MTTSSFLIRLAAIALSLTTIQFLLNGFIPQLAVYMPLFWISQLFFGVLSIMSFLGGRYYVGKTNKNAFSRFVMMLILGRLFLSIGVIIGYYKLMHPESKLFLVPFFMVYLLYTIYEVLFLSAIGREG
jgi:hypothetical protein